ncbi:MAG: c-type cytochrome biogenesis protein CcmI [Alphaproteobacteria bacterium]
MVFWILAGGIGVLALAVIVWPLLRPKATTALQSSYDMQIYRDQLKEVDSDLARGVLSEPEAKASRTEVSRRLLAAADAEALEAATANAPKGLSRGLAVVLAAVIIGGGVSLYRDIGVPGLRDLPLSDRASQRPTQEEAEKVVAQGQAEQNALPDILQVDPKHLELLVQLQNVLKDRPDDLVGHRMLANNLTQVGQYSEARAAQENVMRILGEDATAADYASLSEIMIVAADFYVSPEAETALAKALELDEKDPLARYYAGILMIQRGEYSTTYGLWSELLAEGPADAPWIPVIESQIEAIAVEAGISPTLPGPSAGDINAASSMTEEERNEMVRGMVGQLSDRLATEGGPPDEWARLIRAYGVLGETAKASAIWNEAKEVFAESPEAIALLLEAARDAEVSAR